MSILTLQGDCLAILPTLNPASIQCCVTSPPYFGLRQYGGGSAEIGTETTPDAYVAALVAVFRGVRSLLRDDGTLWLNLGDSMKNKNLLGIPWRVAFALQADGWCLRSDIIWHKPNPIPESVKDRPTSAHEHVFLLVKTDRYFYDAAAIATISKNPHEGKIPSGNYLQASGRNDSGPHFSGGFTTSGTSNARNVWTIQTQRSDIAHFAMMPRALAERCIKAGSAPGDTILDPFGGAGTTALVADRIGRNSISIELNAANVDMAHRRIRDDAGMFSDIL